MLPKNPYSFHIGSPAVSETCPSIFSATSFVVKFSSEPDAESLDNVMTFALLITDVAAESILKSTLEEFSNNKAILTSDRDKTQTETQTKEKANKQTKFLYLHHIYHSYVYNNPVKLNKDSGK